MGLVVLLQVVGPKFTWWYPPPKTVIVPNVIEEGGGGHKAELPLLG